MVLRAIALAITLLASVQAHGGGQTVAGDAGTFFDVISVKPRDVAAAFPLVRESPDGGLSALGQPVSTLIVRAFPEVRLADVVGLPRWASHDAFDVVATAATAREKTREERTTMLRAILRDRFGLAFHWEQREREVFQLVVARSDGRLGPQMRVVATNCDAKAVADVDAKGIPDLSKDPLPCAFWRLWGRFEGDINMPDLARVIGGVAAREVIDNTGLSGYYRIKLTFDPMAEQRADSNTSAPSLSSALREQLGLRLEGVRAKRPTLVVDRLERPSEN